MINKDRHFEGKFSVYGAQHYGEFMQVKEQNLIKK
jgi:hypothetical protein